MTAPLRDIMRAAVRPTRIGDLCALRIDAPPSTNNLFLNIKRGRIKSSAYCDWIETAGTQVNLQKPCFVAGKYTLTIWIRRATLRRDVDNFIKPISDLIVRMGIVEDDSLCERVSAEWTNVGEGALVEVRAVR